MVVVTGASGHLGNVLVRKLVERGTRVRAFVREADPPALSGLDVERARGDLLDPASLDRAFSGATRLIHAAGFISTRNADRRRLEEVNIRGTENVVEAALKAGVERAVFVSSVEAFDLRSKTITDDNQDHFDPYRTTMVYGRTKALATLTVLDAARERGLQAVVAVPSGFIGPSDFSGSLTGRLARSFVSRRLPAYLSGGFDFVDVRDVADGILAALDRGSVGQWYLLTGHQVTVSELMRLLAEVSGVRPPPFKVPVWLAISGAAVLLALSAVSGRIPLYTPNSIRILQTGARFEPARSRRELGYRPRPLRETLSDTVAWWRARG